MEKLNRLRWMKSVFVFMVVGFFRAELKFKWAAPHKDCTFLGQRSKVVYSIPRWFNILWTPFSACVLMAMDSYQYAEEKFKTEYMKYARNYCRGSHNSYTLDAAKRDRVLNCLKNSKNEPSARFRFWVRSKSFRIVQSADGEEILAMPPKTNDPNDVRSCFVFPPVAVCQQCCSRLRSMFRLPLACPF